MEEKGYLVVVHRCRPQDEVQVFEIFEQVNNLVRTRLQL